MESIGGCRLVRRLGEGTRAEIYLGHPQHQPDGQRSSGLDHGVAQAPETVAVKVYRPATELASIDAEIEALGRASSPHLLSLRDLGMDAAGRPALLLERLGPISLARLVADRDRLSAGEAVTILAPILTAVGELHRVGVAHGGIRTSAVLFRDDGAPVLTGFAHAECFGPAPVTTVERSMTIAEMAAVPSVRHDLADTSALVRSVLECAPDDPARRALLEAVGGSADDAVQDPAAWIATTAARLFDYADPLPISFDPAARQIVSAAGPVVGLVTEVEPGKGPVARGRGAAVVVRLLELLPVALPDWVWELIEHEGDSGPDIRGSVRRFLAPVRRPVWIAAACVTLALVVGLGWVGAVESAARAGTAPTAAPSGRSADRAVDGGRDDTSSRATGPPMTDPSATGSAGDRPVPDPRGRSE